MAADTWLTPDHFTHRALHTLFRFYSWYYVNPKWGRRWYLPTRNAEWLTAPLYNCNVLLKLTRTYSEFEIFTVVGTSWTVTAGLLDEENKCIRAVRLYRSYVTKNGQLIGGNGEPRHTVCLKNSVERKIKRLNMNLLEHVAAKKNTLLIFTINIIRRIP